MLGNYVTKSGYGTIPIDLNYSNSLTSTDSVGYLYLAANVQASTGTFPEANWKPAYGSTYGTKKVGLGFSVGTSNQAFRANTGAADQGYMNNVNGVIFGYMGSGPRIIASDYDFEDDTPNTIRLIATETYFPVGKVGIGTTSPTSPLHINEIRSISSNSGQATVANISGTMPLSLSGENSSTIRVSGLDITPSFEFSWSGTGNVSNFAANSGLYVAPTWTSVTSDKNVGFASGIYVQNIISGSGFVSNSTGIAIGDLGVTVNAPKFTSYGLSIGNQGHVNTPSSVGLYVYSQIGSSGAYAAIFEGGNVGVGTTSPGSKLDVKGTLRLSGSTSGYVGFSVPADAGSTTYLLPAADGTNGQVLSTNSTGTLSWVTASGGGGASLSTANTWTATQTVAGSLNSVTNMYNGVVSDGFLTFSSYYNIQINTWNPNYGTNPTYTTSATTYSSSLKVWSGTLTAGGGATMTFAVNDSISATHTATSGGAVSSVILTVTQAVTSATSVDFSSFSSVAAGTLTNMVVKRLSTQTRGRISSTVVTDQYGFNVNALAFGVSEMSPGSWNSYSLSASHSATIAKGGLLILGFNEGTSLTGSYVGSGTIRATNTSGTNNDGGNLYISGGTGTGTGNSGFIAFQTGEATWSGTSNHVPTYRMIINSNGNVGIGNYSDGGSYTRGMPGATLEIFGQMRIKGTTAGYLGFAAADSSSSTTYTFPSADGTNGQVLSTNGTGTLGWVTASGGGYTNTSSIAHVNPDGGTFGGAAASKTATYTLYSFLNNDTSPSGSAVLKTAVSITSSGSMVSMSSYNRALYVTASGAYSGNNYAAIFDQGKVGIGTTSPGYTLDVKGTLGLSGSTSGGVAFSVAANAGYTTYLLPTADGTNGQVLSTNGTGTLSWVTEGGGGGPSLSTANTWTNTQTFSQAWISQVRASSYIFGNPKTRTIKSSQLLPKPTFQSGTGILQLLNTYATNGTASATGPNEISVHPSGSHIYVAIYNKSEIQTWLVSQKTGELSSYGSVNTGATVTAGNFVTGTSYIIKSSGTTSFPGAANNTVGTVFTATGAGTGTGTASVNEFTKAFKIDPSGRFGYSINYTSHTVQAFLVDSYGVLTQTGSAVQACVGDPSSFPAWLTIDPTGRFLYVANGQQSIQAFSIDQTTGLLTAVGSPITGGSYPKGEMAIDPTGKFLYVANTYITTPWDFVYHTQAFSIDQSTGALSFIAVYNTSYNAIGCAVNPTGSEVYFTLENSGVDGSIVRYAINQTTGSLSSNGALSTSVRPKGVAVDPTGKFIYNVNYTTETVTRSSLEFYSTFSASSFATSIATGSGPICLAFDPLNKYLYVSNNTSNTISVYRINNFQAFGSIFQQVTSITADTTLTSDYSIVICGSTNTYTVTLPSATTICGKIYQLKKTGASGTITIATTSSQTIDGASTTTLTTQYSKISLVSDGSNWIIL